MSGMGARSGRNHRTGDFRSRTQRSDCFLSGPNEERGASIRREGETSICQWGGKREGGSDAMVEMARVAMMDI